MDMNRDDVELMHDALKNRDDVPNLRAGATTLYRLMRWTDSHSDGWPYWSLPGKASARLQKALKAQTDLNWHGVPRRDLEDFSPPELRALLSPIKAFLTRQGVDHDEVIWLPERDNRQRTYAQVVINLYLPHDLTRLPAEQVKKIQAGVDSLADTMAVQAEDGIYLAGNKEAEHYLIDDVEVDNEFVSEIDSLRTHIAYGTYEVSREARRA